MSAAISLRWHRAALALLVALVGTAACASLGLQQGRSRPTALGAPARSLAGLPGAARAPVSAALGADDPAYRARTSGATIRASNPAQGLRASFDRAGVTVRAGSSRLSLELTAAGYGMHLRPVSGAAPGAAANRVSYARGALTEWYANGPAGLEQGFTIGRGLWKASGPGRSGGPLTLALRIGGDLRASLSAGASGLVFTSAVGRGILTYTGLLASDGRGRRLPAWLSLDHGTLRIHVDAAGARYPVRIDPVLAQIAQLIASDGAANDHFGGGGGLAGPGADNAVAISGSTIVAGAPGYSNSSGAAYVFTEPASGWRNATQAAELTAPDPNCGAPGCLLGASVGISGSTVVVGAPQAGTSNDVFGRAYVFTEPAAGWQSATQTAELTASDGASDDNLGWAVAVNGPTVVAGAPSHLAPGNGSTGAVYAYGEPPSGWRNATQTAELTRTGGADVDELGKAVAVGGSYDIVAGAPLRIVNGQGQRGAAYVFGAAATGGRPARTCSTVHLRLSSVRILGATGHRIWDLSLRNAGRATCSLRGYPTVRLLNRRGQSTVTSRHAAGFPVATVTLARGARAFFTINYAAAGPCLPHFFSAFGLEVFAPGSRRGLRLRHRAFTLCSVSLGGHPRVTPVRATLNGS